MLYFPFMNLTGRGRYLAKADANIDSLFYIRFYPNPNEMEAYEP